MSIYAGFFGVGVEHKNKCAKVTKIAPKIYQEDDSKPCTCGAAPIKYQHSGVLPSDKDERSAGVLDLSAIPGHISRKGRPPLSDDFHPYHPWLRVGIWGAGDDTIVLTRKQAIEMRDALTQWIELSDRKVREGL